MPTPSEPPVHRWDEPASRLPLRWGGYRARLLLGLALIVAGTGCILITTAYSLPLLLLGSLMQPAGWAILPSTIGRRVAVALPVLGFTFLMLGGSGFAWCYCVPLAAWAVVRLRPLPSYAALILPIAASAILARTVEGYEYGWITVSVMTLVVVAAAWLGRWIAVGLDSWRSVRTFRRQTDTVE